MSKVIENCRAFVTRYRKVEVVVLKLQSDKIIDKINSTQGEVKKEREKLFFFINF